MTEGRSTVNDLEFKVASLSAVVNLNDQKVLGLIVGMQEDIKELKEREKLYVRLDNFEFYSRAFWIVAGSMVSMIVAIVVYAINNQGGG